MRCPVRSPEWKALLVRFDAEHGAPAPAPNVQNQAAKSAAAAAELEKPEMDWKSLFPNEVTEDKNLPTADASWALDGFSCNLKKIGPKLYISATADVELPDSTGVLNHGQGTWLVDGKATTFLQDIPGGWVPGRVCFINILDLSANQENADKAHVFKITDDTALVVHEDSDFMHL